MTVLFCFLRDLMIFQNAYLLLGSIPEVGSSNIMILLLFRMARANDNFLLFPPDNCLAYF